MLGYAKLERRADRAGQQVLDLPAVQAIYEAMRATTRPGVMAERGHQILCEAATAAGVDLGQYDHRLMIWLAGFGPQYAAVFAELMSRAAAVAAVAAAPPAAYDGGRCQRLQALDDSIKFRHARTAAPCEDCDVSAAGLCVDHGRDIDLIAQYGRAARRLIAGGAS